MTDVRVAGLVDRFWSMFPCPSVNAFVRRTLRHHQVPHIRLPLPFPTVALHRVLCLGLFGGASNSTSTRGVCSVRNVISPLDSSFCKTSTRVHLCIPPSPLLSPLFQCACTFTSTFFIPQLNRATLKKPRAHDSGSQLSTGVPSHAQLRFPPFASRCMPSAL
eukprot:RCo033171